MANPKIVALHLNKDETSFTIGFSQPYTKTPIVLVSSFWPKGQNGYVETVTKVSTTSCEITSKSAASDYYINVLVIDSQCTSFGELKLQVGSAPKTAKDLLIKLNPSLDTAYPVVQLTPRSQSGVGHVETVVAEAADQFSVYSENLSKDYAVNYVAVDRGLGTEGGQTLMTGIVNRQAKNVQRVFFSAPFETAPVVLLTPFYDNTKADVSISTVTAITNEYFEIASNANAAHYYVEWLAFGQLKA